MLSDLLGDKNPEIYALALNRGKMLEEMVNENQIKDASADSMFLFGLLSLLDSMLDTPMGELVNQLPLPEPIKAGYIDQSSRYYRYLKFLEALERSMPQVFEQSCRDLGFIPMQVATAYLRSIVWANKMNIHMSE